MVSHFEFIKADRSFDAPLSEFLKIQSSGGSHGITLSREPSYFDALSVEGSSNDVIAVKDSSRIVAVATRSEKLCFVNGRPTMLGYLSNLRIAPEFRRGAILAKGFRFLKELHQAGQAKLYLTTVVSDNLAALDLLTSQRAGLPSYKPAGKLITYLIGRIPGSDHQDIRRAAVSDIPAVVDFLQRFGSKQQFFPFYTESDLTNSAGILKGLKISDILIASDADGISGTLAIWNQNSYRRWITQNPGDYRLLSLICVKDNDNAIFEKLLRKALDQSPNTQLAIALHQRHPLTAVVKRYSLGALPADLFVVHWQDGTENYQALKDLIPYLELGSL